MDIIFGAINAKDRAANIARQEQGTRYFISRGPFNQSNRTTRTTGISNTVAYAGSNDTGLVDNKGDNDQ